MGLRYGPFPLFVLGESRPPKDPPRLQHPGGWWGEGWVVEGGSGWGGVG